MTRNGRLALIVGAVLVAIALVSAFGRDWAPAVRHFLSNLLRRIF
jgi:hypothetical protein